ncbi:sensor histidine kinase [Paenibacillus soyae]|uniref:histidine kinase n=1 Tax=Paenibacillus soyae TaxID=2969249 RepID=A0A9X2MT97_9BACL|nr:HAMP domain-containing sensor histidine kinase [Paenibacillus soyae]MCR2805877.1 ATP-binding protein [Paenibacillus soyae]
MRLGIRSKLVASLSGIILVPAILLNITGVQAGHAVLGRAPGVNFLFVIGFLAAAFILCAYLLTRIVTKSILLPLKELNAAAEQIMNGNLDVPIRKRSNDEMGRFCSAFDVMRIRLKESLERQAAYEQSRNELIANISHDLRTPITSIRGYVEGLQDGKARDEQKFTRYLAVIRNKTDQLNRLIEDLFQFSQLESGQLAMDMRESDSRECLEAIIAPLETELLEGAITLTVERPFPAKTIRVDRDRLAQVLANFIENAQKYAGHPAMLTITARDEGNWIRIVISDNGKGVPEADIPFVFDRFYRGEKSRSRAFGGAGLGLAICKQIVEAHGGQIGLRSRPGEGAAFYVTLPVRGTE